MIDKETWVDNVKSYDGAFVVWVDQGADSLLQAQNSDGVCFAMAFDFVTAYQMGQPGPYNFLNDIRDTGLVPPGTNRIPAKYLDIQAASQAMLTQFRQNLIQLNAQYEQAEAEDKPDLLKSIKDLMSDRLKQRYGPGMETVIKFKVSNVLASIRIVNEMKAAVQQYGPCYFLVGMRGARGGHGIGFGFRPDLSASDKFPAIYEYFDANLGQFTFGTEDHLSDFFSVDVWAELYGNTDYSKFEIAVFPAHRGRR